MLSIDELAQKLHEKGIKEDSEELVNMVHELKKEHLLYANKDCSEIVTIINTDCLT
jgi:hypothetical protein